MRRFTALFLSLTLAGAMVGVLGGSASASVGAASIKKFCKKALTIGADLPTGDSIDDARDAANEIADKFRSLAKIAPKKIKKSIKVIAKWYDAVGHNDANDLQDVADDYSKAIGKYTRFVGDKCTDLNIPG